MVFDGATLTPVAGRLRTASALGKVAAFFQAQKTDEKRLLQLGGVPVKFKNRRVEPGQLQRKCSAAACRPNYHRH